MESNSNDNYVLILEDRTDVEKEQEAVKLSVVSDIGEAIIYTEVRLAFRTDDNGDIGLAVHPMRKEPQLYFPYMSVKTLPE